MYFLDVPVETGKTFHLSRTIRNIHTIRILTFTDSGATRIYNDHQQNTRIIATSVWTKFVNSMNLTWTTGMWLAYVSENLPIYLHTHQMEKQKILCIQKHFNKHN